MATTKDKNLGTPPTPHSRGSISKDDQTSGNLKKSEVPPLTNPKRRAVKSTPKKRMVKDATQDARSKIGKVIKEGEKKKRRSPRLKIKPRHRAVLNEMQKNGGKITKAMIAMSYSEKYADQKAKTLTTSKSFQALLDEHLPEDLVAERHLELLNKRSRRNVRNKQGDIIEYDVDDGPDTSSVTKALEMAYRLRGAYKKDEAVTQAKVTYNLFYKPGIQESMKAFENNLIKQIYDDVGPKEEIEVRDNNSTD